MAIKTLFADSGATKTQWYWVHGEQQAQWTTSGCQPYYRTTVELVKSLTQELAPQLEGRTPDVIQFYGAGCGHAVARARVVQALKMVFPRAVLDVAGDLLGAARATAGQKAGICCILGTGSASGYYDGQQIADQVPSLGYLLGDQGSGADIGRTLLQAYFYRQMPNDLQAAFEAQYAPDRHAIITQLLEGPQPSRHLASYTLFAAARPHHPFIKALVISRFAAFLDGQVAQYKAAEHLPIHAIGSVAHGFQTHWRQALQERGWQPGKVYKSPFPTLLTYQGVGST